MTIALSVENLTLRFGGLTAVNDLSLTLQEGELAGVIDTGFFPNEATEAIIAGPNGVRRMTR